MSCHEWGALSKAPVLPGLFRWGYWRYRTLDQPGWSDIRIPPEVKALAQQGVPRRFFSLESGSRRKAVQAHALIRRRAGPGKGVTVVLSAAGRKQLAAASPVHARAVRLHLVSRLNGAQRKALLTLSQLLHDAAPVEEWSPND